MKTPYTIVDEYDNQGRRTPTFLEMPAYYTRSQRTSQSDVDAACAVEVYSESRFDRITWRVIDALMVIALVAAIAAMVTGLL